MEPAKPRSLIRYLASLNVLVRFNFPTHFNRGPSRINLPGMLVKAAATGDVSPTASVRQAARKAGGVVDLTYQAPLLPFYRK
jgi:hypothetical protein